MMRWLWLAAAFLLSVAAISVWLAFQRPEFVAAIAAAAAAAAWKFMAPGIINAIRPRDLSPEERQRYREGLPWWRDRPPGEGGGRG